ncbi:hypothetical protein [Paenibacillus aquistagni]|uniref:Uncharacterized protein n=1 Tax=Paenibacillus aquistagni TaxID=1852522 RepID=A0A1X7IXK4_9BACL|nr:hypothetical protein [Paenibacillus aquistagni]SMG19851.1 hypothetical protein SAMN06295960_0963 [Paenibacillus aquistagni]
MKKLIFVEGIPGSGKSTFARFLANQFERNGYTCDLFFETTYNHPVIFSESFDDYNRFIESYMERWKVFLVNQSESDVVVMESAIFQSPIVHLLHKDVDRNIIQSVIVKVSRMLEQVNECKLIYFYQEDAAAAIQNMIEIRGREEFLLRKHNEHKHEKYFANRMEQGPESHVTFFLEYAAIANQFVKEVSIETVIIENSSRNYSLYEQQLLNEFVLTYFPDPHVEMSVLKGYTGIYHNQDLNFNLIVELKDNHLYIFGNKKLKAKSRNQFYLDDMSVTANFICDNNNVNRVVITEKDLYANRNDNGTAFVRIS